MMGSAFQTSPNPAGMKSRGTERNDRGEHREDQRHLDPPRTADGGDDPRRASHSFQMNMFGDDDRIVHDDSDGEHEREERDSVDRDVEHHHGGERADPRNAKADGYPEGQPDLQEKAQRDQHQQQPQSAVLEEEGGTLRERRGVVVPDGHAHAVGE